MNRLLRNRKNLIATSIKSLMVVGFFCAIAVAAYIVLSTAEDSVGDLKNSERQAQNQLINLQQRNERAKTTLDLYQRLTLDSKAETQTLNRRNITQLLDRLKIKYRLDNLSLNLSPIRERTEGVFAKKTGKVLTANVSVKFSSISDRYAYGFITELADSFSGYLNIRTINVSRKSSVTEENLQQLMRSGNAELFDGEIEFQWLGLRVNEAEMTAEGDSLNE